MSLTIDSSHFGRIEIDPETIIEFPEGLIGLQGARYALFARDPETPFLWLQCLDDPSLALPVTNPHQFFPGFAVELTEEEATRLGLDTAAGFDVYVTVRAAASLDDFTANLKAPILIRSGCAHQVINQAAGSELRAPLFGRREADHAPATPSAC
ncbi:MAG: flagellar assembly protein FliW [Solirubrobacteraceae bacterium]